MQAATPAGILFVAQTKKTMAKAAKKSAAKKSEKIRPKKKNKLGVKNSLVNNINKRKKEGRIAH